MLWNQEAQEMFNFDKAIFPGTQGGPLEHVIAAKAVCFKEALEPEFKEYQQQILKNTQALCKWPVSYTHLDVYKRQDWIHISVPPL